jgi:2-oxoisovalerate dehydrogenase E1 component
MIEASGFASELSEAQLISMYRLMLTGRLLGSRLHAMALGGGLDGPVYPAIGQEAAQVGLAAALEEGDVYGGTYRDLVAQLVRGVTLEEAMLSFFGKAASPTRGRDGNSHFGVFDRGTLMVTPHAAGAYAVAAGCALASDRRGDRVVVMANCGEGATATGLWHESVNAAAVLGLPIVFTVQNNQYSYSTPNAGEFNIDYLAHRADGYGIPGTVVDGNDVLDCYAAARQAVERARLGGGPSLIEAVTFRHHGHTSDDPGDYVDSDLRRTWMRRDPMDLMEEYLGVRGLLDEGRKAHLGEQIEEAIQDAIGWAREQQDPDPDRVAVDVFATRTSTHLSVATPTPEIGEPMTFRQALASAIGDAMARDERVVVMGMDVSAGGPFGVSDGLGDRFGRGRVVDTPMGGSALVGMAVGAALSGLVPIAEVHHADLLLDGMNQLIGQATVYHWKAGTPVPMVLRCPAGVGVRSGPGRALSPEGMLARFPGIKVVAPAVPSAAKGLMLAAIRDPNPVVVVEHQILYEGPPEPVPPGDFELVLGRGRIAVEGTDASIVTWGPMVAASLAAAAQLAIDGTSVEVIDLQTIVPIDWEIVLNSVAKTAHLLVVSGEAPVAGVAAEVSARVSDELFWDLDAPPMRLAPPPTHPPYSGVLEDAYLPQVIDIEDAVLTLVGT